MSLSKNLLESPSNQPSETSQWLTNERRKAAERELRLVGGDENVDTHAAALLDDFGHATDATSLLLAHQSCPPEFRAFIDAVIGTVRIIKKADSAGFVEVDDKTLAKRAGRSTKWVQQYRNDLREWQNKHDVALIDIRDHYRVPDGPSHPHAYRIHIDRLAVETVIEARRTPRWNSDPSRAMEETARRFGDSAPPFHPRKQKKRRKPSDAEMLESKLKQAAKLLDEAAALVGFNGAWPGEVTIHSLHESIDKFTAALTGDPVEKVSSQYSSNRRVENGGVVEKSSTRIDPTESTTYENRETQPAGGAVEMAVEAARAFDVAEFQVTMLDDDQPKGGKPESFEKLSKDGFEKWLPNLLRHNAEKSESLIVRPVASNLIQLDDCDRPMLERLQPFSLLTFETSAGNYQAILALPANTEKPERDTVRRRLLAQFQKADRSASGAMRWPGSLNHKQGRNKFMVRLCAAHPGRFVTVAELEAAYMLAPVPPSSLPTQPERPRAMRSPQSWPDYERCVREAPKKKSGEADLSIADKNWSILALDRGWPDAEVEAKLCELRDKAKRRPEYARSTVAYAARVVNSRV